MIRYREPGLLEKIVGLFSPGIKGGIKGLIVCKEIGRPDDPYRRVFSPLVYQGIFDGFMLLWIPFLVNGCKGGDDVFFPDIPGDPGCHCYETLLVALHKW